MLHPILEGAYGIQAEEPISPMGVGFGEAGASLISAEAVGEAAAAAGSRGKSFFSHLPIKPSFHLEKTRKEYPIVLFRRIVLDSRLYGWIFFFLTEGM